MVVSAIATATRARDALRARVKEDSLDEKAAAALRALDRAVRSTTDGDASEAIAALATCATIPSLALVTISAARANALGVTAGVCAAGAGAAREETTRALGTIVELLPHCSSACDAFFASGGVREPVRAVVERSGRATVEETTSSVRALETLWRRCASTRETFDWSASVRLLDSESDEVRYNACALVGCALGLSSRAVSEMRSATTRDAGRFHEYAARREARDLEFANERATFWIQPGTHELLDADADLSTGEYAPPAEGYVRIGGVEVRRRSETDTSPSRRTKGHAMIYTESARQNLAAVALALCQNRPVLLEGPAGCGKSAVLEEVARLTGNDDFVTLHLDAQTDSKSLLGAYVCGAAPGEFKWQPGALTQAVVRGVWVLIEDIDLAPFEVLSALVPLLEKRKLYVPGRGESVQAAPGFQLFGSVTTEAGRSASSSADPLSGLWTRVVVEPPRGDEATAILCGSYPNLAPLAHTMLATVRQVQTLCGQGGAIAGEAAGLGAISDQDVVIQEATGDARDAERAASGLEAQASDANHSLARVHAGRPFTLRDLLRWARRIATLRSHELALLRADKAAPPQLRAAAYGEAADLLAGMLPAGPGRRRVLKMIAATWGLPAEDTADATDRLHKPTIQEGHQSVAIGRCLLPVGARNLKGAKWSRTGHAMRLLERVAAAVQLNEPVLLVGETGTGKTALIQELARLTGAPLTVVNLSNQSESADFLGGFKPVNARHLCLPLLPKFHSAFNKTFPSASNAEFLTRIARYSEKRKWAHLLHAFRAGVERVAKLAAEAVKESKINTSGYEKANKRRKTSSALPDDLIEAWRDFERDLSTVEHSINASKNGGPVFAFVEGALVTALREGHWILLDEINLAPAETLERLGGVLESESGSIVLSERGDGEQIPRHPRFRLFGAMNPATDVGKRDLPSALKHRFVEIYAGETESREDLAMIVDAYLHGVPGVQVDDIVEFYMAARQAAHTTLLDSADQKPQYSLRTLSRACEYVRAAAGIYGVQRALFDGFAMSFLTLLKTESGVTLEKLMIKHLLRGTALKAVKNPPNPPAGDTHVLLEHFWVEAGDLSRISPEEGKYVVTETVKRHLSNLARAVLLRRHPILLQGPTSSGKTSLVEYLAQRTGHRFMRINNHEHTDLQEYLGTYVTDETGQLVFQEGALVQAVRKGYWVVLDELNLAPTDVLEALNRLLDDNRELFVPELQETIRPHPHFMLFATQNPPGAIYGGRKVLSKAFRNRFMELHIGDIPDEELKTILNTRCEIAPSYCVKLVEVMRELQRRRQGSRAFAGKDGYITARDLFRWANRQSNGYEELAADGFRVLGERLRSDSERNSIREVLEKCLKVPSLVESTLYASAQEGVLEKSLLDAASQAQKMGGLEAADAAALAETIAWTPAMRRLFALVEGCMNHKEPALLVGETGCGKTSVCQLLALLRGQRLRILNCHQHTETSDFIGGFRPTRTSERKDMMDEGKVAAPFAWEDGPLIQAMREGDILLVDELSLAEDSVLERLNSVLEPGRSITLPEKGGAEVEELTAHPNFLILATMNPGGDFGKKELSPALRNRFTEIWIGSVGTASEMENIVAKRMCETSVAPFAAHLAQFWEFYHENAGSSTARAALAVRDLIGWANFIREMVDNSRRAPLSPSEAYAHGAYLTLLDGLGLGLGMPEESAKQIKARCLSFLHGQLSEQDRASLAFAAAPEGDTATSFDVDTDGFFGVHPFKIKCGHHMTEKGGFALSAPSTKKNAARIMRAMQLRKPILLEGSPGVGKTSIISALAAASGHKLVRLNLSEQTDMMDLLGADLPAAGGAAGEFVWSDGAFLAALKAGDWVLLDELNLAPQPVLEGLNAVLDHRAEVFVPELGQTFRCPPTFRVFAAQNPVQEGGGRKGLPKSFLNRFTRVHVEPMCADDLNYISLALHPEIPVESVSSMVRFNASLAQAASAPGGSFARAGAPWEFNLRDILRWCDLAERSTTLEPRVAVERLFGTLFLQRLRTHVDREQCSKFFMDAFGHMPPEVNGRHLFVEGEQLCVGDARVNCGETKLSNIDDAKYSLLPGQLGALEAVAHCVQRGWMSILVGGTASGKTTIVQMLAALSGNRLRQATLTAATDTSELLGSFEQRDPSRDRAAVEEDIFQALKSSCGERTTWLNIELFDTLWTAWERYRSRMRTSVDMSGADSYTALMDVLRALYSIDGGAFSTGLKERVENIGQRAWAPGPSPDAGKFEWVDGVLLNAVMNGEWVLLENANLCSPTVLDRLNPLLEPEGFLLVNECGLINGKPRVVKAHPNFRLFLAIDPRHGEISRAMRNRGVEVFLLPPEGASASAHDVALPSPLRMPPADPTVEDDITKILESVGVPGGFAQSIMVQAHSSFGDRTSRPGLKAVSSRLLAEWGTLAQELLSRGHDVQVALWSSWSQVYMRGESNETIRAVARNAFQSACASAFESLRKLATGEPVVEDVTARSVMYQPMCWPNASIANEALMYGSHDTESQHKSQTALFEGIVAQLAGQLIGETELSALSPFITGALPVSATMRRIGITVHHEAMKSDGSTISNLIVTLKASARQILDDVIIRGDLHNLDGVAMRLSTFAHFTQVDSLPAVKDEVLSTVNALNAIKEHPFMVSAHAGDSTLRSMVIRGALQRASTELHAQRSAEAYGMNASSCLQLSIQRNEDDVARTRAAPVHACVDVISVVLGNFARFEDAVLRLVCAVDKNFSSHEYALLSEFQDWRIGLENLAVASRADLFKIDPTSGLVASADVVEAMAVVWMKVREMLSATQNLDVDMDSLSVIMEQVRNAAGFMDAALEIPAGKPIDPLLWKHAGRPSIPKTEFLLKLETSVRDICHALQVRSSVATDLDLALNRRMYDTNSANNDATFSAACAALGAGVALRSAALEGLCFFAWTHVDANTGFVANSEIELQASEIPRLLTLKCIHRAKLSGVVMISQMEEDEDAVVNLREKRHICDLPVRELLSSADKDEPWKLGKIGDVDVPAYPATGFPAWSLKWESIARLNGGLSPIAELWSISSQAKLLSILTSRAVQGRDDIMSAMEAMLAAQGITFGISSSPRTPADFVAHRHLLWLYGDASNINVFEKTQALSEHLHDMWLRWHASQWNNSMDATPHSLLPTFKKETAFESPVSAVWTSASGPVRFERATATAFGSAIVTDSKIGCAERLPRILQLRMASRLMRFEREDPVMASREDWLSVGSLTAQVLLSHKSLLVDDSGRSVALTNAINAMMKLLHTSSAKSALSTANALIEACAGLCEVYPPLEELREKVLEPLVRTLCEGSTHRDVMRSAALSGEQGARDRGRRGNAWTMLGLLRLNLLLPAGLSDPAVTVRTELRLAESILDGEMKPLVGVMTWQRRTPCAPSADYENLKVCIDRCDVLSRERERLGSLSIPRPMPSRWVALRRDVERFREGLAAAQRLISLLDKCSELSPDESAMMEAETWLSSSAQWCSRLNEEYSAYRDMTQPIQLAVYEMRRGVALAADSARARVKSSGDLFAAATALFSFPTVVNSKYEGSMSLLLSEERVLHALSEAENISTAHLSSNPKSGDLALNALRVALTSALSEARLDGALSMNTWQRLSKCFTTFAALYENCREEDLEAEREATEIFKQATKGPTSYEAAEANDNATEERAYRIAFKDFSSDYAEFKDEPGAPLMLEHDCIEDGKKEEDEDADDEANITRAARMAGILEGELAEELVNVHYAALATLRGAPTHITEDSDDSTSAQEKIVRSTRLMKYGKYVRNLSSEEALRASEFARAYDTGISVLKASQLSLPVAVDYASRLGHSLRVALEHSAVSKPALSMDTLGASPYESQFSLEEDDVMTARTKRTQVELDEDAAADAIDSEMNVGGCPGEMALLVPPVAAARRRLAELLEEWPEHPLLTQLAQICDRMLSLPLLGPVKAGLTGIELLLARAQIWEESAASHTSLKEQLSECAKLALRWRARELRTWPRLLARCSERHASRAKRTWFAVRRLLSSMKSRALLGEEASDDANDKKVDLEKFHQITVALEEYLQGSTIGEFDTRLELIWCFYAEFEVEIRACRARGSKTTKQDDALCAVLHNVWRYYSQFQNVIDKHVEAIRKPCEIKLRDHAKLAKWEDRGFHAMKVQGEANQRSLHKFVRAFDTALNGLVLPILEKAASQTGFKELSSDGGAQALPMLVGANANVKVKPSNDELEVVRSAREAGAETMRHAELDSLRMHRQTWVAACDEANTQTKQAVAFASQVAQQIKDEQKFAIADEDENLYQSRLPSLVKRAGDILGDALNGEEGYDVRSAGAESLDDFAVTIASRANALRDDKAAKKAIKKKALQDLLKALPAMGIKHSRGAVPAEYRTAAAWFTEAAMKHPRCLSVLGQDTVDTFHTADKYYYRSMARIQRLWRVQGLQNPDLTSREMEIATLSCEHLLHILRLQRLTISAAAEAEADIDVAYVSLLAASERAALPSQQFSESYLIEQYDLVARFEAACIDVSLVNRAVCAAEPLAELKTMTPAVTKALNECKQVARRSRARLEPFVVSTLECADLRVGKLRPSSKAWRSSAITSDAALDAIRANFNDFKGLKEVLTTAQNEAQDKLHSGEIGLHGANALPGWDFLRSIVEADVERQESDFNRGVYHMEKSFDADESISRHLESLRENIENVVQSSLLWVQGVDAASKPIMVKREIVDEGEDEEEEADGTMETYEAAVGGALNPKRLDRLVCAVRDVVRDVKIVVDQATEINQREWSQYVVARVGALAPLLGLLRSAVRTVLREYINFHKSSCKLESVLTALFLGLSTEGFCIPPEETEGEAGGGMMDDQSGTGMGAGEGKKDVADEIENEDQIMGMEDLEKEEEEEKEKGRGEEEDEGGIEMQNEFEGITEDVDPGDDNEEKENGEQEMEKEMGEDGDDGDVIDERMWNDEDDMEENKNEAPEKYEKGSSVKQDDTQETETRAAEDEENDGKTPKEPEGEEKEKEEKEDPKQNDQSAAPEDDEGAVNDEEVEENHGLNPNKPEPEEFQMDDLNFEEDEEGEENADDANDESMRDDDAEETGGDQEENMDGGEKNLDGEGEMNDDGDGGITEEIMDVDDKDEDGGDDENDLATDDVADDANVAEDAMDEDGEDGGPKGQGTGGGGDQDVTETQGQGGETGANAQGSEGQGEEQTKSQPQNTADAHMSAPQNDDGSQLPPPQSSTDIPSSGADGEGTGAGVSGGEGTVAPMAGSSGGDQNKKTPPPSQRQQETNPHRSLGDALKKWRERLNVVGDAAEHEDVADQGGADAGAEGNEYEFERDADKGGMDDDDANGEGGIQTLANATEEQALRHNLNESKDDDDDTNDNLEQMEMQEDNRVDANNEGDQGPGDGDNETDKVPSAAAAAKQRKKNDSSKKDMVGKDPHAAAIEAEEDVDNEEMVDADAVPDREGKGGDESKIALQLEYTSLDGSNEKTRELTAEDVERARMEAEQSLTQWREKASDDRGNESSAQNLWRKLEQLTTSLSAELAEKLRLILEPTLASRLQGDFKTGKRLNMRKIIPYIASDFRKDKIWLRRSRPSARKYQVMLAIDDSRSMAENHCGHIALESMVLLARAMARLEVGEIGVVGFGAGANAVRTLHPLGAPFTDQDGPSLVSKLSFAEDNTLADRPMVQLLETINARLAVAREQIRGGGTKLQQLVLIIADGRFHEKEALRRCMREVGAQRGLLVAFIVLDNPQNSLLNMQSVSFAGGKPVMKKYLDSFPFPFYVLVQDVSQLPATISDLLRQWFEMTSSHD